MPAAAKATWPGRNNCTVVRELVKRLPDSERQDPTVRELASYGCSTTMHLVRLLSPRPDGEDHTKDIDFTRAGIQSRWQAGYEHGQRVVLQKPWECEVDAWTFITSLPADAIGEIHLAGYSVNRIGDDFVLVDDHGSCVPPAVWSLYALTIERIGLRPTLIEWDSAIPELKVLLGETMWADLLTSALVHSRRFGPADSQCEARPAKPPPFAADLHHLDFQIPPAANRGSSGFFPRSLAASPVEARHAHL